MLALSAADNMIAVALFVVGEGYGFGMCLFTTTMLLVNYYGPKEAPKTMGTMHSITTGPCWGRFSAVMWRIARAVLPAFFSHTQG